MIQNRERRSVQRIHFEQPLRASVQNGPVSIVDLSLNGARVQHDFALTSGKNMRLDFEWNSRRIVLSCRVIRCRLEKPAGRQKVTYFSGLRFTDGEELRTSPLRNLIADRVSRELDDTLGRRRGGSGFTLHPAPV